MNSKKNKRLGAAKKEMEGFDVSLEKFNSISTEYFDEDVIADIETAVQTDTKGFLRKAPQEKK